MSKERLLRRSAIAALGLVALAVLPPAPAGALPADPITVQPGQSLTVEYGPIPGQDTATPNVLGPVDPMVCEASPACNLIVLEFAAPEGFNPEDDTYLAELVLTWPSVPVGDRNAGAASNDLDLYVWAAAWAETDPGEPCHVPEDAPEDFESPEYCSTNLARSAGPLPPERVRFDATSHRKYLLSVNNATGVNLGYTIEITSRYERFVEPTGIPDADFVAPSTTDDRGSTPSSSGPGPSAGFDDLSPAAGLGGSSLGLEPLPGEQDAELAGLEGGGLPGSNFLRRPAASVGPAKPVSGATVAIWLALLPIVLGAGAAYWFVRRRPSALRISFPTTTAA
jgi:hypothetical protein